MRTIPIREFGNFTPALTTEGVVRAVIERPVNGVSISDIRARCKILDALDASSKTSLQLENSEYETLLDAMKNFQFGMVNRELLQIIDDITGAV